MPANFTLQHDSWERLVLTDAAGQQHVDVVPIRCFPMSERERWISICNDQGHELVFVEDASKLPEQVRQVLEADLTRREFTPVIQKIISTTVGVEPAEWKVRTDRGDTSLLLKSEDDVRRLGGEGALVIDAYGTRYLIHDVTALDAHSRRILERYL